VARASTKSKASAPRVTLQDAAALLVAIEPGDAAGRKELRAALGTLGCDATLAPAERALLLEAADVIDTTRRNATPDYVRVRGLLEGAIARAELRESLLAAMATPNADALADASGIDQAAAEIPDLTDLLPEPRSTTVPTSPAADESATALPPELMQIVVGEDADTSLISDFIAESRELLAAAEAALLRLEADPDDAEAVNVVFRTFHTIKGTSAFLALDPVTEFAHHAESVLDRVRSKQIRCTGGYAELTLTAVDLLTALLDATQRAIGAAPVPVPPDYGRLLEIVRDPGAAGVSEARAQVQAAPRLEAVVAAPAAAIVAKGSEPPAAETPAESVVPPIPQPASETRRATKPNDGGDSSVRVRTERLDRLIDLVGELVIAQAMISQDQIIVRGGHHELTRKVSHAEKIVRELQDLSMAVRMVPLRAAFQKVARLVRDVAERCGKQVQFVTEGEDTEIDRNMVDFLADPLLHMVRNAVDHGLESPADRRAAGKPETGVVKLAAYHAGGNVVVQLSDDGRGLDRARIVRKAIQQGLIASGDDLSDTAVWELIFAPGFSTAEEVSSVSGRGVGMDVVKRNVEAVRGRVDISSQAGQGTVFTVRLPLTLAITDGLLVRVGAERYIVPALHIHVSFRPDASSISTVIGRGEMVVLRDEVLPVVRLHRVFGVPGGIEDPSQALLMVVGDGAQRAALLVDELLGKQQVVAKSLGAGFGKLPGISGGAILGDGRVGLILDVNEVLAVARHGDHPGSAATRAVA
jgi:two-component system, chemotaxis family, sensor kinase CheA